MSRPAARRGKQGGFSLPLLLIGGAITIIVLTTIYEVVRLGRLAERGRTLAGAVTPFHNALVAYTLAKRDALIATPTGPVAGVASPLAPTCAELKALMPSLLDYSCTLPERAGTPLFSVTKIPTGCAAAACDLALTVTTGAAVGSDADASEIVQKAVNHFGAEGGQSLVGYPGTIRGTGWERTNPLGNVARVFGTYSTYGASTLSNFVTLYDTRNPNFLGDVSVAGSITSATSVSVGNSTCKFTELTIAGRVIARSPTCVERVLADGAAGTVETKSATGATTVQIGERIAMFNSSGTDKAGFRYTAVASSEVYADSLTTGTATVDNLAVSVNQTVGAACTANTFGRSSDGRWLECFGGVWRYSGIHQANVGDACVGGFAQDISTSTRPLICRNNVYVNLNEALGLAAIIDSMVVIDGTVVPAPTCAAGTTADLILPISKTETPAGGGTFRIDKTGSGPWTISITGSGGGEAIAWRVCKYPSY